MNFEAVIDGYHLEAMSLDGDVLWFSDVFAGGIHRRSADGHIDVWLPDRRMVGGLLQNEDGKILVSGYGGIVWFDPRTGATGTLIDKIDGKPVPGVNEMIPDGSGGIYFGVLDIAGIESRWPNMEPGGLYHLDVRGKVRLIHHGIVFANGIGMSPDRRTLYCNHTLDGTMAYPLAKDGMAGMPVRLRQQVDCDGIAIDSQGDLWSVGTRTPEIVHMAPDGTVRELIVGPAPSISNIRFGGADGRWLYITGASPEARAEYRAGGPVKTRGSRISRARVDVSGMPILKTRFHFG